ncbi:hypothetical protein [Methylobacter sp. S3L5C]|uniref:hypothetical protein n=1 Tax=Methylobacter sp. S3L5C TaxID=2839024 RepID=UPI001FAD413C|nr:hypothetical protein [Methylobacter sp. S3L5C]UOA08411.1 hypothetical protein KKZ03_19765 [Methylobacter sp. S3L5C]
MINKLMLTKQTARTSLAKTCFAQGKQQHSNGLVTTKPTVKRPGICAVIQFAGLLASGYCRCHKPILAASPENSLMSSACLPQSNAMQSLSGLLLDTS